MNKDRKNELKEMFTKNSIYSIIAPLIIAILCLAIGAWHIFGK